MKTHGSARASSAIRLVLAACLGLAILAFVGSAARAQDPATEPAESASAHQDEHAPPAETAHEAHPATPDHAQPSETAHETHPAPAAAPDHEPTEAEEAAIEAKEEETGELDVPDVFSEADIEAAKGVVSKEALAALIRKGVAIAQEKVVPKLEKKMMAKHEKKMNTLTKALGVVSLGGLLLLFMPLFLAKKYPGKMGVLMKFSAIAAVSAVITLSLFAGVVLLIKGVQGLAGHSTNPQLVVVNKALEALDHDAEYYIDSAKGVIEPSLNEMGKDDGDLPAILLDNASRFVKDAGPFISAAKAVKGASFIFEYIPVLTTGIAVLLFLLGARPILKELMAMPGRAAAGGDTRGIVSQAFKYVGEELIAAIGLIVMVIVTTLVALVALDLALGPIVGDLLDYTFDNLTYAQTADASSGTIFASLILTAASMALNVVLLIVSGVLYLGKFHKILQARVHEKVPLGTHKKFWIWGSLAFLFTQAFPYVFFLATRPILEKLSEGSADAAPSWTVVLLAGPVIMVVGWLFVLWAARGIKGLAFILKYKPLVVAAAPAR